MGGARLLWAWIGGLAAVTTLGCATGEALGGGSIGLGTDAGAGGSDAGPMPMPTTTATTPPTSTMPMPTAAPEMDAAPGDSGDEPPMDPPCPNAGLKRCAGICINPSPTVGCSLTDCTPCPADDNGVTTCDGETCLLTCNEGYALAGEQCFAPEECTDGELNNTETDTDCGGDLCPPCPPGDACEEDDDCDRGPCESSTCGCTELTCEDVSGCGSGIDDGCGGTIDCTDVCGGTDVCFQSTCCPPITSCEAGLCGPSDDGCGGTVDCGSCAEGTCIEGECCVAKTAAECASDECGTISDGCGGTVDCGDPCGGNPCIDGQCCTPSGCTMSGCGFQSDGCGGSACDLCPNDSGCDDDEDCVSGNCEFVWLGGCGLAFSNCCRN